MSNAARTSGKLRLSTPSDREIAMTRAFDAPRKLVWDALTKPELVKRWLGVFSGHTMALCEIDLRVGGRYRYVWRLSNGAEMGMGGVYRDIVPLERLVATERFDGAWSPGEAIGTVSLKEQGGRTTMTTLVLYDSKEVRDGVLKSPMETGVAAGYETLDGLLASLG